MKSITPQIRSSAEALVDALHAAGFDHKESASFLFGIAVGFAKEDGRGDADVLILVGELLIEHEKQRT